MCKLNINEEIAYSPIDSSICWPYISPNIKNHGSRLAYLRQNLVCRLTLSHHFTSCKCWTLHHSIRALIGTYCSLFWTKNYGCCIAGRSSRPTEYEASFPLKDSIQFYHTVCMVRYTYFPMITFLKLFYLFQSSKETIALMASLSKIYLIICEHQIWQSDVAFHKSPYQISVFYTCCTLFVL